MAYSRFYKNGITNEEDADNIGCRLPLNKKVSMKGLLGKIPGSLSFIRHHPPYLSQFLWRSEEPEYLSLAKLSFLWMTPWSPPFFSHCVLKNPEHCRSQFVDVGDVFGDGNHRADDGRVDTDTQHLHAHLLRCCYRFF